MINKIVWQVCESVEIDRVLSLRGTKQSKMVLLKHIERLMNTLEMMALFCYLKRIGLTGILDCFTTEVRNDR